MENVTQKVGGKPLFKVLVGGGSCHGGSMVWSLPTANSDGSFAPGEWHEVAGPIIACRNGLHLTTAPAEWWKGSAGAYVAEGAGACDDSRALVDDCKVAFQYARLLRPATAAEMAAVQVFTGNTEGRVSAGKAVASDSATVRAWDSATVRASGSATVESAWGHPIVSLTGNAVWVDRRGGAPVVHGLTVTLAGAAGEVS
jgi:hypothetical protein